MSMIKMTQFEYSKQETAPLPFPAAGELHIWWADTDANPHKSGESRRILTGILSRYLSIPEADIRIETSAHGKPYLSAETADLSASGPASAPLYFNLSHAGTKMVLVFSTSSEVGIDLESLNHAGDREAIAARFFHPDERQALEKLAEEEKKKKFFSFWTEKEAFLKGTGEGLTRETSEFTFESLPDGSLHIKSAGSSAGSPDSRVKKDLREGDSSWRLCEIPAPDGYVCTAAWQVLL